MRLLAEAVMDDRKRVVVVSFFDWETPAGRRQRNEVDGYRAPGNWPFNLVPHRIVALPMIHKTLLAMGRAEPPTRHVGNWR